MLLLEVALICITITNWNGCFNRPLQDKLMDGVSYTRAPKFDIANSQQPNQSNCE